jgi:hypothetical protein
MLRMLRRHWPLFTAIAIALIAFALSWRPGVVIGYFRDQASSLERFTLVLFLVFLMPPLCGCNPPPAQLRH